MSRHFGGLLGGGKSGGGDVGKFSLSIALVVAVVVWVVSGFYTIREAERGVVLRLANTPHNVDPRPALETDLHRPGDPGGRGVCPFLPASGFMLTGWNVVRVEMDVQYRVVDPRAVPVQRDQRRRAWSQATDSALRYVVGHTRMDDVLTTGREKVRQETRQVIDSIIEPHQMGLQIVDVNFLPARPPEEVKDAFDDAISAQEDEQRFIRGGKPMPVKWSPRLVARSNVWSRRPEAYKSQIVLKAKGEVARFNELLPQYQAARADP